MSLFSSLFGKKTADDGDAQGSSAPIPSSAPPTPADVLSPPPVERKPFVLPPGAQAQAPSMATPSVEPVVSPPAASEAAILHDVEHAESSPVLGQLETDLMTREDIIAAYKIFLRRRPVIEEDITPRIGMTGDRTLFDYLMCDEFTNRPEVAQLIFNCAKKIVDAKKSSAPPNTAMGVETSAAQAAVSNEPVPGLNTGKPSATE